MRAALVLVVVLVSASAIAEPARRPSGDAKARPQAAVTFAPMRVSGTLPRTDVERVVKARKGVYRACYQIQLERHPDLAGTMTITFSVGPDGGVTGTTADKAHPLGEEVETCLTKNFARLRFPVRSGPTAATVTMTFGRLVITT